MMLDERPTAAELVAAVADFLEGEVGPALDGRLAFHAKVAVNALRIVERELVWSPSVVEAERDRLRALTGTDGDPHTLNTVLAEKIRTGELSLADVRGHLIGSVLARIAIDNPRYPSLRDAEFHGRGGSHGGIPR